ncbi:MAG: DUF6745 domain-containing protein [Pirellulaceae bacterium]
MFLWLASLFPISSLAARRRIMAGTAPPGMRVVGGLRLWSEQSLRELPRGLTVDLLDVGACTNLSALPSGLKCRVLLMRRTHVSWLPPDLIVREHLNAEDCRQLRELPWGFTTGTLILRNCTALTTLPHTLRCQRLDIGGCTRLQSIPAGLGQSLTHLAARGCTALTSLPETLLKLVELDVSGCTDLTELPEGMQVHGSIDVAGSGLRGLPGSMRSTRVLWRGVPVSDRVAFDPEGVSADEILDERNLELRRILLERVGLERFMEEAKARVVDADRDRGGERRLLHVGVDSGDDIMCVAVNCPSTGKRYLLRVPPTMRTCHQAIAWTAGFTDPDDYRPLRET